MQVIAAIFDAAHGAGTIVVTKDSDFLDLLERFGPPPQVVWVSSGNSSNSHLRGVFKSTFSDAVKVLATGASFVEIADA